MESAPSFKRRPKRLSLQSREHQPDNRQVNYEDMFTALVPHSTARKRRTKSRNALPPLQLSGQDYLDQLLFYSRTKPLPPLPTEERPFELPTLECEKASEVSPWTSALRRWKRQFTSGDSLSRSSAPKTAPRQSSLDTLDSKSSDCSKSDARSRRHFRFKSAAFMPWTTPSTNVANRHSFMYGDLAEFPATKTNISAPARIPSTRGRDSVRGKVDRRRTSEDRRGASSRMAERRNVGVDRANETHEVSREDWEYLWRQYQQLSRLMQEALRQRTAELA